MGHVIRLTLGLSEANERIDNWRKTRMSALDNSSVNGGFACGSYGVLNREQAAVIVEGHTFMHNQYKAVSFYSCRQILGDRLDLLLADPIRGKGPTVDTIYPWNVIDYMVHENPRGVSKVKATASR